MTGLACRPGWRRNLSTSPGGPPTQVQSSSHSVETSQERSAGNIKLGKAPFQTTSRRSAARWRPAAARLNQHTVPPLRTRSLWAHRGRRRHRRPCRDTPATTAGLPTARSAARARPGHVRPAPRLHRAARPWRRPRNRRDRGSNAPTRERAIGDPRDLSARPDAPRAAVPGPHDHPAKLEAAISIGMGGGLAAQPGPEQGHARSSTVAARHTRASSSPRTRAVCGAREHSTTTPRWVAAVAAAGSAPPAGSGMGNGRSDR